MSEELFQAVQEILKQNKQQAFEVKQAPEVALLRAGFAVCGYCGRMMQSMFIKANRHYRYFCASHRDTKLARGLCAGGAYSVKTAFLDEVVWGWFLHAFQNPEVLQKQFEQWRVELEKGKALEYDRLKAIEAAMRKAEARKRNYMSSAGDAEDDDLRAEFTQLARDAGRQAKELAEEQQQLTAIMMHQEEYMGRIENLMALGAAAFEQLKAATYEDKRIVLHAFKVQVKVWQKDHQPPFEITWGFDALHERWVQEGLSRRPDVPNY